MNIVTQENGIPGEKFKAVISNRIYLTRTKELHEKLVQELTYILPAKKPGSPPEKFCDVTRVNSNILTIPAGRLDLVPANYEIIDKRSYNTVRFPKFKQTLRESQQEVYDDITDNCLINANPSWGKTFTGVAIATKLSQKTLIIVHTLFLRDQWVGEIKKCLGIEAGLISGGKYNIGPPIVVANIQSLRSRIHDIKSLFGTIIVDECHHTPATVFKEIVDNFKARYKIGLSATLWRKDGKQVLLTDFFSKKIYKPKDENALKPLITIVNVDIKLNSTSNTPWGVRINELMDDHSYMELVINLSQAQAARGYKVLTVADRTEFLTTCSKVLDNFKLIIGETDDRSFDPGVWDGIFGSVKIFAEGVNIPPLSCLILANPLNNRALLEQLIGRICRTHEGKMNPEVIDIALSGYTAKNQLAARINYYMEKGYEIRYI